MSREIVINGEALLEVKGGAHMSGQAIGVLSELGLTEADVRVSPQYHYTDRVVDGYGPHVPADVQCQLAWVDLSFTLVHYDAEVLDTVMDESLANGGVVYGPSLFHLMIRSGNAGTTRPTGTFLGKRKAMYESGNNFFSLNVTAPGTQEPWRFRQCHLWRQPAQLPLGVTHLKPRLTVRALPYSDPLTSGTPDYVLNVNALPDGVAVLRSGALHFRRREALGSGAIIWDRVRDEEG